MYIPNRYKRKSVVFLKKVVKLCILPVHVGYLEAEALKLFDKEMKVTAFCCQHVKRCKALISPVSILQASWHEIFGIRRKGIRRNGTIDYPKVYNL